MNEDNIRIEVSGSMNELSFNMWNVIDGFRGSDPKTCNCCFVSDHRDTNGWLQLDLGKKYLGYQIRIFGRTDGENIYSCLYILVCDIII